jgi:hypothetical protein
MKLVCSECRRENEPERIYCHDCGARLDRSSLAKEKSKEEDPQATQKRLKSMLDPQRALMRRRFFQGSKLVLGALAVAAIVQMVRPPDLPEQPEAEMMLLPSQINMDLENAAMNPRSGALSYTEEQVNAYLEYALKSKKTALSKLLTFERAIVQFEEGYCLLTVQRSLFGFSVYTTGSYQVALRDGAVTVQSRGGRMGRMPIHPALMEHGGIMFQDVITALDRDKRNAAKLGGVEFHPKSIVLAPKQA